MIIKYLLVCEQNKIEKLPFGTIKKVSIMLLHIGYLE